MRDLACRGFLLATFQSLAVSGITTRPLINCLQSQPILWGVGVHAPALTPKATAARDKNGSPSALQGRILMW